MLTLTTAVPMGSAVALLWLLCKGRTCARDPARSPVLTLGAKMEERWDPPSFLLREERRGWRGALLSCLLGVWQGGHREPAASLICCCEDDSWQGGEVREDVG